MINIPIYRAKNKIRDDYIVGYYDQQREWKTKCNKCNSLNTDSYHEDYSEYAECFNCGEKSYFHNDNWIHDYQGEIEHLIRNNGEYAKIDPTTLAIHFPDMLDSQGNKIFASLSEDGKGGDCIFMENGYNETFMFDGRNSCIVLKSKHSETRLFGEYNKATSTFSKYTIVGIQQ